MSASNTWKSGLQIDQRFAKDTHAYPPPTFYHGKAFRYSMAASVSHLKEVSSDPHKKNTLLHMPIDKYEMHTTSRTAQRTGELNLLEAATEASFCVALQGSSAVL